MQSMEALLNQFAHFRAAVQGMDQEHHGDDSGQQYEYGRRDAARLSHPRVCRRLRGRAAMSRGGSLRSRRGFVRAAPLLAPPQLDAADLSAPRLRQLLDELDLARILVRRRHALAVVL